jgi:hypothetical protein
MGSSEINFKCAFDTRRGNFFLHKGDQLKAEKYGRFYWLTFKDGSEIYITTAAEINELAGKFIIPFPGITADLEQEPAGASHPTPTSGAHRTVRLSEAGREVLRLRRELFDLAEEVLQLSTIDDFENIKLHARLIEKREVEQ